jgi:hypothetical protein
MPARAWHGLLSDAMIYLTVEGVRASGRSRRRLKRAEGSGRSMRLQAAHLLSRLAALFSPECGRAILTGSQRELLTALAWWRDMGHASVTRAQLAAKAGWKAKGSHLRNRLSELRTGELIEYRSDAIATARGVQQPPRARSRRSCRILPGRNWLNDSAGSHLRNRLSEFAAMEIVDYPTRGQIALPGVGTIKS